MNGQIKGLEYANEGAMFFDVECTADGVYVKLMVKREWAGRFLSGNNEHFAMAEGPTAITEQKRKSYYTTYVRKTKAKLRAITKGCAS